MKLHNPVGSGYTSPQYLLSLNFIFVCSRISISCSGVLRLIVWGFKYVVPRPCRRYLACTLYYGTNIGGTVCRNRNFFVYLTHLSTQSTLFVHYIAILYTRIVPHSLLQIDCCLVFRCITLMDSGEDKVSYRKRKSYTTSGSILTENLNDNKYLTRYKRYLKV